MNTQPYEQLTSNRDCYPTEKDNQSKHPQIELKDVDLEFEHIRKRTLSNCEMSDYEDLESDSIIQLNSNPRK